MLRPYILRIGGAIAVTGTGVFWNYTIDVKQNGTDLRKFITTDQTLCRGSGGGTHPPVGGLGGSPPKLGFSQKQLFAA
ncbi:MAG: hypothetical protein KME06_00405 [Kastovskya adunca ATA6-11-RM4]|nr:hypothetical protein [Kastovskya adunca ATA6-11-RM4]